MQGHARCTHVQVASATLGYITRTVATQLATNTVIIFLLYNGCLLWNTLGCHRLGVQPLKDLLPPFVREGDVNLFSLFAPHLKENGEQRATRTYEVVREHCHSHVEAWDTEAWRHMYVPCHRRPLASSVSVPMASLLDAAMRCPLTQSAGTALSVVSWVMGTENRMNGRAAIGLLIGFALQMHPWDQQRVDCESLTPTQGATPKPGL